MKKIKRRIIIVVIAILALGIYYYTALPALNIHSAEFWIFLGVLILLIAALFAKKKGLNRYELKESKGLKIILGVFAAVVIVYLADRQCGQISETHDSRDRRVCCRYRRAFL